MSVNFGGGYNYSIPASVYTGYQTQSPQNNFFTTSPTSTQQMYDTTNFTTEKKSDKENKAFLVGGIIAAGVTAYALFKGKNVDGNILKKLGAGFKSIGKSISNFVGKLFKKGNIDDAAKATTTTTKALGDGTKNTVKAIGDASDNIAKASKNVSSKPFTEYSISEITKMGEELGKTGNKKGWRKIVAMIHPDKGGSHELFVAFNNAYNTALMAA